MTVGISAIPALSRTMQGEEMLQPEEVAAMLRLHELGWGAKRLAKEFGGARNLSPWALASIVTRVAAVTNWTL